MQNKSKDETNGKDERQRRQDPVRHCAYLPSNTGVVEDLDLSKVQLLNGRQVKWIKCILEGNAQGVFLENLKPAVWKAVSETSSSSKDSHKDSINEDDSSEYVYHESEHESTDDQEEFPGQEEVMTKEQVAQMQEYLDCSHVLVNSNSAMLG